MKTVTKLKQNSGLWERYWIREKVIDAIRGYFKAEGFHEVEVPLLLPIPSTEPFLEVFETELRDDQGNKWQAFLPSSPEFALKKLLCAGSGSIFTITKSFRNGEGRSRAHNPEFTILEWYRTPGDYMDIAKDFEGLMRFIWERLQPTGSDLVGHGQSDLRGLTLTYQDRKYSWQAPWERISVGEAFQKYTGINIETMLDEKKLKEAGEKKGYQVSTKTTWEEIWNQIMANEIEPQLGKNGPTILYDYPIAQAALARPAKDPRFAERFEVFMGGMELGNCFSELTDWREQERRCLANLAERKKLGKTEYPIDNDFIDALKMGMPETGGIAVGVDRLVALFADVPDIADTMFFPAGEMFPQGL